jgi:hypothetical protein
MDEPILSLEFGSMRENGSARETGYQRPSVNPTLPSRVNSQFPSALSRPPIDVDHQEGLDILSELAPFESLVATRTWKSYIFKWLKAVGSLSVLSFNVPRTLYVWCHSVDLGPERDYRQKTAGTINLFMLFFLWAYFFKCTDLMFRSYIHHQLFIRGVVVSPETNTSNWVPVGCTLVCCVSVIVVIIGSKIVTEDGDNGLFSFTFAMIMEAVVMWTLQDKAAMPPIGANNPNKPNNPNNPNNPNKVHMSFSGEIISASVPTLTLVDWFNISQTVWWCPKETWRDRV